MHNSCRALILVDLKRIRAALPSTQNAASTFRVIVVMKTLLCASALSAAEFIPLGILPGESRSEASDVSNDGRTVVGVGGGAFLWTGAAGIVPFEEPEPTDPPYNAKGISGDGVVAILNGYSSSYRWRETEGYENLGGLVEEEPESYARGISDDGSTIVGNSYAGPSSDGNFRVQNSFRWTQTTGLIDLGALDPDSGSNATAVSSNGDVVVGNDGGYVEAFRWTQATGMVGLGSGIYDYSRAFDVSADGSMVLGGLRNGHPFENSFPTDLAIWKAESGWTVIASDISLVSIGKLAAMSGDGSVIAFQKHISTRTDFLAYLWTEGQGERSLADVMANDLGLGDAISGWSMDTESYVSAISSDGRFVVGAAKNPLGQPEAFLVDLQIPEPTTAMMFLIGLGGILGIHRSRCSRRF
jgi:probable HAF family extracellular repeat protein